MTKQLLKVTGTLHYDDGSETEFRVGGQQEDDPVAITLWRGSDLINTIDANTDYKILASINGSLVWFLPPQEFADAG